MVSKKILEARQDALRFINYSAGINSSFLIWHDPWVDGVPLIRRYDTSIFSLTDTSNLEQLSVFMARNTWRLPTSNHVWVMDVRRRIGAVCIGSHDSITWAGSKKVTLSFIYESIRVRNHKPPWVDAIWHRLRIPKCSFFLWLALRNRLLTKDHMLRFGLQVDVGCVLCNSGATETVEHIFTTCSYTKPIFDNSSVHFSGDWNLYLQGNFFVDRVSRFKEQLAYLYLSVAGHTIWKERNQRIHNLGHRRTSQQLIHDVKQIFREKVFSSRLFQEHASRDNWLISELF